MSDWRRTKLVILYVYQINRLVKTGFCFLIFRGFVRITHQSVERRSGDRFKSNLSRFGPNLGAGVNIGMVGLRVWTLLEGGTELQSYQGHFWIVRVGGDLFTAFSFTGILCVIFCFGGLQTLSKKLRYLWSVYKNFKIIWTFLNASPHNYWISPWTNNWEGKVVYDWRIVLDQQNCNSLSCSLHYITYQSFNGRFRDCTMYQRVKVITQGPWVRECVLFYVDGGNVWDCTQRNAYMGASK